MFDISHYLNPERIESVVDAAIALVRVLLIYATVRWILLRFIRMFSNRIVDAALREDRRGRVKTLGRLIENVTNYLIITLMVLTALKSIGVDIAPLLATAGVAGLAIGFGAQKLVKDIIGGFFLLAEEQYNVGEVVTIGAQVGTVSQLGMRVTKLKDFDGKTIFIPNGDVGVVVNHSRLDGSRCRVSVKCKPTVDPHAIIELMIQQATEMGFGRVACGVSAFDATGITIEVTGMVLAGTVELRERELRAKLWQSLSAMPDVLA